MIVSMIGYNRKKKRDEHIRMVTLEGFRTNVPDDFQGVCLRAFFVE